MKNQPVINELAKWTGTISCAALGAFLSGFTAILGATLTGLKEGGWNFQFVPFLFGGWIGGGLFAIIAIVACKMLKCRSSALFSVALFIPPGVAFICGIIAFPVIVKMNEVESKQFQEMRQASIAKREMLYKELKRDPEIALRESWFLLFDEHISVFNDSLTDKSVPYTLELVKRFYNEAPRSRDMIFKCHACDTAFLTEHFQEAYDQVRTNMSMLASIVSNPNTPIELVEKVANSKNIPVGVVHPAQRAMKNRAKTEQ